MTVKGSLRSMEPSTVHAWDVHDDIEWQILNHLTSFFFHFSCVLGIVIYVLK